MAAMGEVTISAAWVWLVGGCTGLMAIINLVKLISRALHPDADAVKEHSKQLQKDKQRLDTIDSQLADIDQYNALLCKAMLAQINHELSGNDVSHLREVRDDLQAYLAERGARNFNRSHGGN